MNLNDENPADTAPQATTANGKDAGDARAVGWRKMFPAFPHRNYRVSFSGQLVSRIGSWVNSTAEGWLVY